jgi:hypothetical protein
VHAGFQQEGGTVWRGVDALLNIVTRINRDGRLPGAELNIARCIDEMFSPKKHR